MEDNTEVTLAEVVAELQEMQLQNEMLVSEVVAIRQDTNNLYGTLLITNLFVIGVVLLKVREWILSLVNRGVKNV